MIVSYNFSDGGAQSGHGSDPNYFGVIRVLNGQNCQQLETIRTQQQDDRLSTPSIGDLDGDGVPEIVTNRGNGGLVAFRWDAAAGTYVTYWTSVATNLAGTNHYDGPSIHDLDDDGFPEVLSASEVYDGKTGDAAQRRPEPLRRQLAGNIPVLGDLDNDGQIEMLAGPVWR